MSSLREFRIDCLREVEKIGGHDKWSMDDLANNYCKAVDENNKTMKSVYMSALILKEWFQLGKMYEACKQYGYSKEDCFDKLVDCINVAMQYRAWQNPEKHTNAQACVHQTIANRGIPVLVYDAMHRDIHKANTFTTSLESTIGNSNEDDNMTVGDTVRDYNAEVEYDNVLLRHQIQQLYVNSGKIIEAILLDRIAFTNSCKKTSKTIKTVDASGKATKYKETTTEFSKSNVIRELNELSDNRESFDKFTDYFCRHYRVNRKAFEASIEKIKNTPNPKLYKYLEKTLSDCRNAYTRG